MVFMLVFGLEESKYDLMWLRLIHRREYELWGPSWESFGFFFEILRER